MKKKFGLIILAAGASERLGRPKQRLVYREETLLNRMIRSAVQLDNGPVIVVLGADADTKQQVDSRIINVINTGWKTGMAGSIKCGLEVLMKSFPESEGVIITVCDQPFVTKELLQQMIDQYDRYRLPIIACSYGGVTGTPVLFHKSVFPELMMLEGDKGAKSIVQKQKDRTGLVNFPLGNIDIDTEEDYAKLLKTRKE